jgi:hypothetical protein
MKQSVKLYNLFLSNDVKFTLDEVKHLVELIRQGKHKPSVRIDNLNNVLEGELDVIALTLLGIEESEVVISTKKDEFIKSVSSIGIPLSIAMNETNFPIYNEKKKKT